MAVAMDDMDKKSMDLTDAAAADLAPVKAASMQPEAREHPPTLATGGTPVPGSALSAEELEQLTADIVAALKTVYDPEIPSDIYELGLIYKIDIADDRAVTIDMTLTAPGCPVAGEMPLWVENAVNSVQGVQGTTVNLTFDPPWDKDRMSEEAKLAVGMY
jgi:FeS assembly SUF system protein